MRTYDVLSGFTDTQNPDRVTTNASCVVAFFRFKKPVTYSRKRGGAISTNPKDTSTMRAPLFALEDVFSASVTSSKTNHVSTAQVSLRPGKNYLSEVLPGDFMFVWMNQDPETSASVLARLDKGDPCNGFDDGLKFFGRVSSVRKQFRVTPSGTKQSLYFVSGGGFLEFDGSMYFEPNLAINQVGIMSDWLQRYGLNINNVIASDGEGVTVNKIIPLLLEIFYGKGIPKNLQLLSDNPRVTEGMDNPFSFAIPESVGKVFGVRSGTKPHGLLAYSDLLEVIHGVQKYSDSIDVSSKNRTPLESDGFVFDAKGAVFQPDGANRVTDSKSHYTQTPQLGTFLPTPPTFTGQRTAWATFQQFLNPSVNEMYTALRTNYTGGVYPTLVCRQLPFSSGLVDEVYRPKQIQTGFDIEQDRSFTEYVTPSEPTPFDKKLPQTYFLELPRWIIHPALLRSFDVGRSDALRFNFVHVTGEAGAKTGLNVTGTFIRDPPIRDDLDIARSGL
jgi:hypothetical protein